MGLRTLVLAVVLLALVAYVSSAPVPSESSESKSHSASESFEVSKSHSDESTSTSVEKHDLHQLGKGQKHRRDVTEQIAPDQTTLSDRKTVDTTTSAALKTSSVTTTTDRADRLEHDLAFYPLQTLFP